MAKRSVVSFVGTGTSNANRVLVETIRDDGDGPYVADGDYEVRFSSTDRTFVTQVAVKSFRTRHWGLGETSFWRELAIGDKATARTNKIIAAAVAYVSSQAA